MKTNEKKTWSDPLVELANRAQTKEQKKLRGILRAIARFKNTRIPKKIVDELERVNKKVRFIWVGASDYTIPLDDYWRSASQHSFKIDLDNMITRMDYEKNKETGDEKIVVRPAQDVEESVHRSFRPHLGSWQALPEHDSYLWSLIPRLRDADWVAALRECPECKKLLMSSAKWKNKFCSEACKNKYWGRKNRAHGKEDPPDKPTKCPVNDEAMTITPDACINGNGINLRGKFEYSCPTCPHNKKGGK